MRQYINLHYTILLILLVVLGVGMTYHQYHNLGMPFSPNDTRIVWDVEAKVSFEADEGEAVSATLLVPGQDAGYVALRESYISRNYGLTKDDTKLNRKVTWTVNQASGKQNLYYRLELYKHEQQNLSERWDFDSDPYVKSATFEGAEQVAASAIIDHVTAKSSDRASMTNAIIQKMNEHDDDNVALLLNHHNDEAHSARLVVKLLSLKNVPARVVHGVRLHATAKNKAEVWVAVYNGNVWQYFDPVSGGYTLAKDMLIWWEGDEAPLIVKGGHDATLTFSVIPSTYNSVELAKAMGSKTHSALMQFSLSNLPVETQHVYKTLVTIPLGVLVILILRNLIGITTFGTFMPVLVALAFRETHVVWGCVLFLSVVFLGLFVRHMLDRLRLLMVPRLGIVLTTVIMVMSFISTLSYLLDFGHGLSVALFPMVVLTMTIERISIIWEERGSHEALFSTFGSLFTAICAYYVMNNTLFAYMLFVFPGLHFILIAIMLLMGRYRGYRLSEWFRFKAFLKQAG